MGVVGFTRWGPTGASSSSAISCRPRSHGTEGTPCAGVRRMGPRDVWPDGPRWSVLAEASSSTLLT